MFPIGQKDVTGRLARFLTVHQFMHVQERQSCEKLYHNYDVRKEGFPIGQEDVTGRLARFLIVDACS